MRMLLLRAAASSFLVSIAFASSHADACTTFCSRAEAGPLLAKSFDWGTGTGFLVANERGRARNRLIPGGSNASWTSRFASLSFSTVGPGFPIGGMNEAGLTVEALVDLAVTPAAIPDPQRLTGLELIQYALDRFDTVADFASFAEQQGVSQLAVPLHFFTCDASGACAAIESRDGRVHATRGAELGVRVLANRPYSVDLQPPAAHADHADQLSSGDRFATIARAVEGGRARDVDDAFRLLDTVRVPSRTKWQIVWNIGKRAVSFRDREGAKIATVGMDVATVRCDGAPRVRAIGKAS